MEVDVQFPAEQIIYKPLQLSRLVDVLESREAVHVSEGIYGDQGQIVQGLAHVKQRMNKELPIRT